MNKALQALCYLDDIAHGRKMNLDPHELKLIIEKELNALESFKKYLDYLITDKENYIEMNRNLLMTSCYCEINAYERQMSILDEYKKLRKMID